MTLKTRALYSSLLLSMLLHLGPLYLLFWRQDQPRTQTLPPLLVEIIKAPNPATLLKKGLSPKTKNSKTQNPLIQKLLSTSSVPSYKSAPQSNLQTTEGGSFKTNWGAGSSSAHFGKNLESLGILQRIYRDLEGLVYYPAVLASHEQEGAVKARIVFGVDGHCDWKSIEISSNNTHFRVFILDTLRKLCRQTYTLSSHKKEPLLVDISFIFEITERNDREWRDSKNLIVGNVLHFYRNSHQSAAQWHLGPFTGVFPIPFVQLDFQWLIENWETHIEGKDPLREFRSR